ncbi:hypothetical protein CYMTET_14463 [Cymbomonas tetramitiformis]|uniref:Uncharacterized protein n=1 Tax=Cymbomonas tetramitiformis TaxID=36881 RepID=A0AAE0LAC8_9CHLO|nr:hypothetical protein CYMTET_14463 [Cymbomonas tetramitiformis]
MLLNSSSGPGCPSARRELAPINSSATQRARKSYLPKSKVDDVRSSGENEVHSAFASGRKEGRETEKKSSSSRRSYDNVLNKHLGGDKVRSRSNADDADDEAEPSPAPSSRVTKSHYDDVLRKHGGEVPVPSTESETLEVTHPSESVDAPILEDSSEDEGIPPTFAERQHVSRVDPNRWEIEVKKQLEAAKLESLDSKLCEKFQEDVPQPRLTFNSSKHRLRARLQANASKR